LVEQVAREDGGSPALRLLHAVREFARGAGPPLEAEERHAAWFARLGSRSAISALDDQGGARVLARVEAARDDLRLAAGRAPALGLPDAALGCARALLAVARFLGPILAGSEIADRVLAMPGLDPRSAAELMVDRARALVAAGRHREAGERLDRADQLCADDSFRAETLRLRASARGTRGTAEALDLAAAALLQAEKTEGAREIGRAKCTLGVILRSAGRGADARVHLEAAVELLRAVGDARTECTALEHLGRQALDRGRPVRARSLFHSALELARGIGARAVEADLLERIATLAALSDSERAGEEFGKALSLRRSLGHRLGEGYTLANLGAYEAERRPAAAREPLEKALGIALELADKRLETASRANLGELYLSLGRLDHASRHLDIALRLAAELGQPRLVGFVTGVLAQVAYAKDDPEEGRRLLLEALAVFDRAQVRTDAVRLLERAAQCELDAGNPEAAGKHYAAAIEAGELSKIDRPATLIY
jgi:tetratricopeptide (TPR) repeat protein